MPSPIHTLNRLTPHSPAEEGTPESEAAASLEGTGHMRIARDGMWYHEGGPIRRIKLVKLFNTILRREQDGTYWLVTPAERVQVYVDDAPYVAEEVETERRDGQTVLHFRTNLDAWVEAGPDHPIFLATSPATGEICPYIRVAKGLDALLARSVFYALAEQAVPDPHDETGESRLGVWSNGVFYPLVQET